MSGGGHRAARGAVLMLSAVFALSPTYLHANGTTAGGDAGASALAPAHSLRPTLRKAPADPHVPHEAPVAAPAPQIMATQAHADRPAADVVEGARIAPGGEIRRQTPAAPVVSGGGMRAQLAGTAAQLQACTRALDALGAAYKLTRPITPADRDCGIARPVTLTQAAPGVAMSPPQPLRCEAALALARWVNRSVLPAARALPQRRGLMAIEQAPSYACRRRNNLPTGKPSEHSLGNAADIAGFRFRSGPPVMLRPRDGAGTNAAAFQRAIRRAACEEFTTVLGPGADAYHANHLHLDIRQRRNGYRICK